MKKVTLKHINESSLWQSYIITNKQEKSTLTMAGKSGGFFKRLKQKQKQQAKKASRGTTGMKKEDRILKHNAMVDINAAKRRIDEIDAISSSDDDVNSEASSDHIDFGALNGEAVGKNRLAQDSGLNKLRALLGVDVAPTKNGKQAAHADGDSADDANDEDENSLFGYDDDGSVDEVYDNMPLEDDGDEELEELGEEMEEEEDEEGEEGQYMIPESNWDDLFKNVEGAAGAASTSGVGKGIKTTKAAAALTGKRGREQEEPEDDELGEDEEDDFGDVEEEDNEDEANIGDNEDEVAQQAENVAALLPEFRLSTSEMNQIRHVDSTALGAAVVEKDPWYARYYAPVNTSATNKKGFPLAVADRPPLQPSISSWEEPTLDPATDLTVSVRGTPAAVTLLKALAKEGGGEAVRPPFVHDVLWDLWCHYRAKLRHQQSLAQQRSKQSPVSNEPSSLTYRSAMSPAEIASAGLLSPHELTYFNILQSYGDVLDATKSWDNAHSRRELTVLHMLNHWIKTKTIVTAHNEVINRRRKERKEKAAAKRKELEQKPKSDEKTSGKKKAAKQKGIPASAIASDDEDADDDEDVDFRDQSFGKTRTMLLLPMRNSALEYVETILRILYAKEQDDLHISEVLAQTMGSEAAWHVDNDPYRLHKKAQQGPTASHNPAPRCEYFTNGKHVRKLDTFRGDFSEVEENLTLRTFRKRPEDFRQVFYGNMDDCFCFGMSLGLPHSAVDGAKSKKGSGTQHTSIYSHVLNSDILICSPLGLRKRLGKAGDVLVSLSSIEVSVVDQADVLVMQNWEHLQEVTKMLNERPRETTEGLTQISRLFEWAMRNDITKSNPLPVSPSGRRQNIILTAFSHSTIQSTFRGLCEYDVKDATDGEEDAYATLYKAATFYIAPAKQTGVIPKVTLPIRQHFLRYDATTIANADDERFDYFTQQLFPSRIQSLIDREVRTILFVPSYFDFVRLRNHFFNEHRELTAFLSEYSTEKQQRQVLGQFTDMERPFLIMTERFYFFKRYFVRLAEQLVFYSPPIHPSYYSTLISKLNADSPNASVMLIYGKYDTHELVRIAGTERAKQLLERAANSFAFVTNGSAV